VSNFQTKLKESKLKVENEKEVNKELEDELLMFKKKSMEQYEMGFFKVIR